MQLQHIREAAPDPQRRRLLNRALWITVGGNLLLALGKGLVATLTSSVALYADAANSASDLFYSLLMVLGLSLAQRPPDITHPQGHGRFEPLSGLIVAAAMTLAGFEAGRAAVVRWIEGGAAIAVGAPTITLLLSAGVKVTMYQLVHRIARKTGSSTLDAAAKDNFADVLTSSAALVGTLGSRFVHPITDALAGVLVALWILRSALEVWRENLKYLTGGGAPPELQARIVNLAWSVKGVTKVHQVITEYVGPNLIADLHINVDGNLPLFEAHAISDAVQGRVLELDEIERVYVHVEPCDVIPRREEPDCKNAPGIE